MNRSTSNVDCTEQERNATVLTSATGIRPINATNFDYAGHRITRIDENAFKKFKHLESINLSDNEIEAIPDTVFDRNTEIKSIDLKQNRLRTINTKVFSQMKQLRRLDLSANLIERIDRFCIRAATLVDLNLSDNNIVSIHTLAFFKLPNLKVLNLSKNRLENGTFYAFFLQSVNLESNRIRVVDAEMFFWHRELRHLNLLRNQIATIPANAFKHTRLLEQLQVEVNDTFEFASIADLIHVKSFKLICHGFCALSYECLFVRFFHMVNITTLYIAYRHIIIYSLRGVRTLINLKIFHLECLEPTERPEKLKLWHFVDHPKLEVLHFVRLNAYQIGKFARSESVSRVKELFLIRLFNTRISTILNPFQYLESLSLSYSKLQQISAINFKHLLLLKHLSFENSQLKKIAKGTFKFNSFLVLVSLRNCSLTTISQSSFANPLTLQVLDVRNNPLERISRNFYEKVQRSGTMHVDERVPIV